MTGPGDTRPRWPLYTLAACVVAALLAAAAITRLRADTSLEAMFSTDDPAAAAMSRVLGNFAAVDELLVLATAPGDEPAPDRLTTFARQLEEAVANDPAASRLSAAVLWRADEGQKAFFERVLVPNAIFYLDDEGFAAARGRLTRDAMDRQLRRNERMASSPGPAAQALAKALLKDPLHLHEFLLDRIAAGRPIKTYGNSDAFLSPDGRSILIRVRGKRPVSDLEFSAAFTREIRRLAERCNSGGLELHYTGSYAIAAASQSAIRADMIASVVTSVVLLQALFLVAYRRPLRSFLTALLPVAAGILYGFGAYAVLRTTLTPINAVIGGILAGMAIDYSIQFLAHHDRRRREHPDRPPAANVLATLAFLWPAMLAAFATSLIGFLAIGSSDVKALRDFSLLGSLGLAGAFVATVTLLPSILALLGERRRSQDATPLFRFSGEPLVRALASRPVLPLVISGLLFVAAAVVVAMPGDRLPLESDLAVMHPKPNPALEAQSLISSRMGIAPGTLVVHLRADSPDALIRLSHDVRRRLETPRARSGGVASTFGLASLLPDPTLAPTRVAATGPEVAARVTADFRAAIADSAFEPTAYEPYAQFLQHLLTRGRPPGIPDLLAYPSLAETILPKSAAATMRPSEPTEAITLVFLSGPTDQRDSRDAAVQAIRTSLADLPGATLTGLSVLSYDAELHVRRQLPRLVAVAFGLVAAYLAVHFRKASDVGLALLHTAFSAVCLVAFMRLTGQRLNMMNLVAFPLLIGIDVDYAIFLITSVRDRARLSFQETLAHLGTNASAVLLCAASTFFGFGSLVTTSVPAIRSLGVIVAAGIACSLLASFFLVTPIVLILSRRRAGPIPR